MIQLRKFFLNFFLFVSPWDARRLRICPNVAFELFIFFQIDTVFNPHPAAAAAPWVDNTAAVVDQHPVVPQPMIPDQHIGHDSEGIDGFPREVA